MSLSRSLENCGYPSSKSCSVQVQEAPTSSHPSITAGTSCSCTFLRDHVQSQNPSDKTNAACGGKTVSEGNPVKQGVSNSAIKNNRTQGETSVAAVPAVASDEAGSAPVAWPSPQAGPSDRGVCQPVVRPGAVSPCHTHSLPEVWCHLAGRQQETRSAAVSPQPATPVARQSLAARLSATSGIRVALQSVSLASPLSSMGPFCRICHEGESRESLISPCRCTGSVGLVHVSCIEKWLSAANKDSCEICMYKYETERRPKPLLEWLLNPSNPEDARNLIGDVICFFLLTALAVIATYLCLMGASHYLSYKTQWEATGLVVLGLLISCIYCIWLVVTCRYHCRVWRDWRRTHQDVHLLEMKLRAQSSGELNNNNSVTLSAAGAPPPALQGAGAGLCRSCAAGSLSCPHCCRQCPFHAAQLAEPTDEDVFEAGAAGGCRPPQTEPADEQKAASDV